MAMATSGFSRIFETRFGIALSFDCACACACEGEALHGVADEDVDESGGAEYRRCRRIANAAEFSDEEERDTFGVTDASRCAEVAPTQRGRRMHTVASIVMKSKQSWRVRTMRRS